MKRPDDPAVKTDDCRLAAVARFRQRAALWNVHLPATGWEQHELASFRDYWTAEGKVFHRAVGAKVRPASGQPAFAKSKANATGGNHAEFRYNPGDQRSYYEQFTEWGGSPGAVRRRRNGRSGS